MSASENIRFAESHEYALKDATGKIVVGISAYAVDQLQREIVYVELPEVGREVGKGDAFGLVEAVKAASDVYAPVSGTIVEVNTQAIDDPMLIANDPYGEGWMIKIEPTNPDDLTSLKDAAEYDIFCQTSGH
ncbi:MAG: glycine cleavage system protein GcvH [Candidatus Sumerlaeales bacterium]|nr:glycine cleavage system protein GcvH [Candidatus Sumerlaeales bacterium]